VAARVNLTIVHETDRQLERGLNLHRAGNVKAAAEIYQKVIEDDPNQPDALYLMGCLLHQAGDSAAAVELLERAIQGHSERAEFYYALGTAQAKLGKFDLAESNLRQATRLGSRAEFHISLGTLLKRQFRLAEAIVEFEAALNLQQNHAPTLALLRQALTSANRNDEAIAYLDRSLAALGTNADRLCDFANALQEAEDFAGAIDVYHRALALETDAPRAWYACGCAEIALEDFASAIVCFQEAAKLRPEWLEARHNLGRALYEMGQVSQAYDEFKVCAGRKEEGTRLARAMMAVIAPGAPQAGNRDVLEIRQAWARDLGVDELPVRTIPLIQAASNKLKIGYVSSFFSTDNWMKPVWGLINQHDRRQFDIYLFSDAPRSAILHGYNSNNADHFFDTKQLSNKALAELIRDNGIQVLVDLSGYSDMNRLPMYVLRPAPVLVGWFNMYATTGMTCFDYLIGDREVIPAEEEPFYLETIQRVTHSYLTFSVDYPVPPVAELPCITNAQFTFGCFGSQYKITSEVVEAWSRILIASPGSRLLLKNKRLGTTASREFMEKQFRNFGVSREQLEFEGPEDHFHFLKAYDRVDIALDTFPYNGGTTTTESIWQGVPVVTFGGDRWASRTSASILCAADLREFVADDLESYIARAIHLANTHEERSRLAALRREMRNHLLASSACDTIGFAREMEEIYRTCWKNHAQK
jgi:predicted O-linked N-acetylglucosamine transferase (SPINDLY family)